MNRLISIRHLSHTRFKPIQFSSVFIDHNDFLQPKITYNRSKSRHFSLKETFDSLIKTQTGIFKSISESTPVEYLQKSLVYIHDTTGLPWWATIVTTTIILRSCVTVPLAVYQNYILAKIQNLHLEMPDIVKDLKKETAMAVKMYNWDEKTTQYHYKRSLRKQWDNLIVRENCHPFKATLIFWVQLPMWVCFSVSLRNLVYMLPTADLNAKLTFTELTMGGFGWIPNLVQPDASLILPITLGIVNLAIIEIQALSKVTPPSKFQRYVTHFFRGVTLVLVPIAAYVPSCMSLYWVTSSTFGLIQNLSLMSPKVKRVCRIPQTLTELDRPYLHLLEGLKNKLKLSPENIKTS